MANKDENLFTDIIASIDQYMATSRYGEMTPDVQKQIDYMCRTKATYNQIIDYAKAQGYEFAPRMVKRHKEMLPLMDRINPEVNEEREDPQMGKMMLAPEKEIMSLRYVKGRLQNEYVPRLLDIMIQRVSEEEQHMIPHKESVESMEKIIKVIQLLGGDPTEIVKQTTTLVEQATNKDQTISTDEKETIAGINALLLGGKKDDESDNGQD